MFLSRSANVSSGFIPGAFDRNTALSQSSIRLRNVSTPTWSSSPVLNMPTLSIIVDAMASRSS